MNTIKKMLYGAALTLMLAGVSAAADRQIYSPTGPVNDSPTAIRPQPIEMEPETAAATAAMANTVPDADNPFIKLRDAAVAMFKPVSGKVVSVENGGLIANIASASGVREGMRLDIFRKSKPFIHPVTKQSMGFSEQLVGKADVVKVSENVTRLKIMSGKPEAGDLIRVSEARVPVLFYPNKSVPWSMSEEYYVRLRESNRFDIAEVPVSSINSPTQMLDRAKEIGAVAVMELTYESKGVDSGLTQRIVWADDGTQMLSNRETISPSLASAIAVGESLFAPKEDFKVYSFSLPDAYRSITAGNFDGYGTKVLAMALQREIDFFRIGFALAPAYQWEAMRTAQVRLAKPVDDLELSAALFQAIGRHRFARGSERWTEPYRLGSALPWRASS